MANDKKEELKKESLVDYHFPGNGEFKPVTIKAVDFEAACDEWEKIRELNN